MKPAQLTDEEIKAIWSKSGAWAFDFARAIEAAVLAKMQAQSEPVAWFIDVTEHGESVGRYEVAAQEHWGDRSVCIPLYAAPVQQDVNQQLLEALKRANTLLAELTFSDWIPRTDTPSIDIRQRINAAHVIASSSIAAVEGK